MSEERSPVEYMVKELSLIGNEPVQAGQKVFYAGLPADNLEPLCDEGRKRAQEYIESNAARVKAMIEANAESGLANADAFLVAFRKELSDSQAQMAATIATAISDAFAKLMPAASAADAADAPAAGAQKRGKAAAEPDAPAA